MSSRLVWKVDNASPIVVLMTKLLGADLVYSIGNVPESLTSFL